MPWWETLMIIVGGLLFVMGLGVPVAFAFLLVNLLGILFLQGGSGAFHQFVLSIYSSVSSFTLTPVPLFVLMGEILWRSQLGKDALDALDKCLGRLPGRLSVLTIAAGTVFSSLSGSTMANTAMLGTFLYPDLERRGYHRTLSIGPIMAGGGLAMMIPPSALAVILAAIGQLSIAKILISAIVPGLMMAALYFAYIVIRCALNPDDSPSYTVDSVTWPERIEAVIKHLLPLGFIVFLVTGLIVLGVATPTESAALGALGSFALAAAYGRLNWAMIRASVLGSLRITAMMFAIMAAAIGFSQLLAYSGATRGLLDSVLGLDVTPILLVVGMQLVVLVLGSFMEQIAIMLITLPIFIPIVKALDLDTIWFGVLMLINLEMALMTPPFGLLLFIMKGITPPDVTMKQIYVAAIPFLVCNLIVMAILILFPELVTFLHPLTRR
ncbi:MAG: TRAP transporter large permease subunit [Alphaproteobacteria bacterium]|nr:TRAP transporter large permease subunit [Alphaproteobacteria bacterium]